MFSSGKQTKNVLKKILVINGKGGAGKSTLSTNLAGFYAAQGKCTVIKDYDPQGSSSDWLGHRPYTRPEIHCIDASRSFTGAMTSTWANRLPREAERLVIDSPAGVDLNRFTQELLGAHYILVPVMPSPIDIRASALFIRDVKKRVLNSPNPPKIGAVASRVPAKSSVYQSLKRVFENLEIPLVATLHESEYYLKAAEHGVSLLELEDSQAEEEKGAWTPLFQWLDDDSGASPKGKRAGHRLFVVA